MCIKKANSDFLAFPIFRSKTSLMNADVLKAAIDYCRHYLPRQGRLEDFIHHNTLHAFTDRPFDAAVCEAWALYGNIPYPKLRDYHQWIVRGDLNKEDLFKIIEEEVPGVFDTHFKIGNASLSGRELVDILMSESAPFKFPFYEIYAIKFRAAERVFKKWNHTLLSLAAEGTLDIYIPHLFKRSFFEEKSRIFQEALNEAHGLVLRCLSAYCDQGVSHLELPARESSLLSFFFTYCIRPLPLASLWRKTLSENIKIYCQKTRFPSSSSILLDILTSLSILPQEWKHYLFSILYRFKGWSALLRAMERKENELFQDFIALLVMCELSRIQENYKFNSKKIQTLGQHLPLIHPTQKIYENNLRGIIRHLLTKESSARNLLQTTPDELLPLFQICLTFHNFFKRKLFQRALDQKSERDFLTAAFISQNTHVHGTKTSTPPKFISLFCIDEREESFRRYLEECEPNAQTAGAAGHFGLNIEFQAYRRSHYRKLCPARETPFLRVKEIASSKIDYILDLCGKIALWIERATLNPIFGTFVTLVLSPFISVGLFFRLFFPQLYGKARTGLLNKLFTNKWKSTFTLEAKDSQDYLPRVTQAIASTLLTGGLKNITTPYLFVVGHGSTSLNNPHEAAHDCGACAGGRGWPNTRLFAELANRPDVRQALSSLGVTISPHTRFIATYHNTSSDNVEFMDLPDTIDHDLKLNMDIFRLAAKKNAWERSRRFLDISIPKNVDEAKTAMVHRSLALDQVRPEYGHATNAFLVIGPRELTRRIFMDRRCFLCSYNFQDDPEGQYLKGILETVMPVCVGINLEYYFSWVDKQGYGCDTKIPHNINGLNGVMNGYMSDLLLGLPLQMTEIHQPVRLKVLIEAPLARVTSLMQDLSEISHEVHNEWFYLGVLDPETKNIYHWSKGEFKIFKPSNMKIAIYKDSLSYINGKRDFLDFAIRK